MKDYFLRLACDLFHGADRFIRHKEMHADDVAYWCRRCAKERIEYGVAATGW